METKLLKLIKSIRLFNACSMIIYFTILTILLHPYPSKAQVVDWNNEFELGFTKFQQGDWKDALSHLERIVSSLPTLGLDDDSEGIVYYACGICTQQMGDINRSIQYNSKALALSLTQMELRIQLLSSQFYNYSDLSMENECKETINDMMKIYELRKDINLVSQIMTYYCGLGKFSKVIEFESDIPYIFVTESNTEMDKLSNTIQWNTIYMSLAHSFKELKEFNKALEYYQKSLNTITKNNEKNRSVIYSSMSQIYMLQGDKSTSLKYQQLSFKSNSAKEDSPEQQRWYANRHLQLGILYTENGLYKESIECFQKADSLYILINDTDYHSYVLVRLYNSYHVIGNKVQYDKIRDELLLFDKDQDFNNPEISLIVASQLGKFYEEDGNYEKALKAYTNSLKSSKSFYGEGNPKIFPICYELASLYLRIGDWKGASEYMECLRNICELHPNDRENYMSYIYLHCEFLEQLGQIGNAIDLLESKIAIIDKIDNIEMKSVFYDTLSRLYATIGDFEQALTLDKLSLSLCEEATGTASVEYAHGLLNLGESYSLNNNYSEAFQSTLKAIDIIRTKYGTDHPEYYGCLRKLAVRYSRIDKKESQKLRKECLILSKNLFGENSIEYADNLIYSVDLSLNPSHEDIEAFRKALEIRRNLGRDFDKSYLSYLNWYSVLLFVKQDWKSLLITSNEILKCTKEFIYLNFQKLSSSQREMLWNIVKHALSGLESYAAHYSQYAVEHGDYSLIDDFGKVAYNTRLIKKGLLLESNKRLSDLIMTSIDSNVVQIYHRIEILKRQLTKSDLNTQDILSLKTQLFSMERELIQRVAPNGEFVDFLSIDWKDVQAALNPREVAIEFFSYPVQDRIQYGAVILSSNSYPLAFALFCEDELDKFAKGGETSYDYDNPNLYHTIWATLENFSVVRNAQIIYFSADNILNTIAIENLIDRDGLRANDKRRLYRLSSTREIVTKHPNNLTEFSAILYGGLNYDAPLECLAGKSSSPFSVTSCKFKQHSHIQSSRGTYEYLPGTLDEINSISQIIKGTKLELRSGVEGSEESFIALNGSSPSIIHLATHGFFYEPEDIEDKLSEDPTKYSFLNIENLKEISVETQAMHGSGILLSGANLTLRGISIPGNMPDGILTAEELSNLNLRQTDLTVLSACETGLGATTEEGVWGLQRGFKLAGVKSLLMSLWKVDDMVTSKMMQYFYESISKGLNKIQALQEAQKRMRDNPETSQPYFWAGWILLDGLN